METDRPPLDPMPAATLILVREHAGEIETHLLLRGGGAAFMSGKYVFPGGRIDSRDRDVVFWEKHVDLKKEEIAARLGGDFPIEDIISSGVAAIRETLEEAGVFLADGAVSGEPGTDRICALRILENLPKSWFKDEVVSRGWILNFSKLFRWAHWITPERMRPRFDTRFFLAFMPEGQTCRPDLREIDRGIWISPEEGLKKNLIGQIPLSPPTLVTLQELLPYRTKSHLMEACRKRLWGKPLLPKLVPAKGGEGVILEPWDKDYSRTEPFFDPENLEKGVLSPGESFSKIWYNGTVWRPVKA